MTGVALSTRIRKGAMVARRLMFAADDPPLTSDVIDTLNSRIPPTGNGLKDTPSSRVVG